VRGTSRAIVNADHFNVGEMKPVSLSVVNLANLITTCRIVLAPILLILAWRGMERPFVVCFSASLISDVLDGKIARCFNLTSEFGAHLDSWADILTYTSVPVATWLMRPDLITNEKATFVVLVLCFMLPIIIGVLKFGCLTTYHTRLARISACLLGVAAIVAFMHGSAYPLRIAVCFLAVAAIEEICVTLVLPEARSNVRSLEMALGIRLARFAAPNQSTDPTFSSGTPGAGHQSRHP